MRGTNALVGALFALVLAGCATPYDEPGPGIGFEAGQIEGNRWQVVFTGSHETTMETVQTYWLYHCAELTLEKGYDGFEVVSDTHFANYRPQSDNDARVIPVHTYGRPPPTIYVPVYPWVPTPYPAMDAEIKMVKQPFVATPPKIFDAKALKSALEPIIKAERCSLDNICPHAHNYLMP